MEPVGMGECGFFLRGCRRLRLVHLSAPALPLVRRLRGAKICDFRRGFCADRPNNPRQRRNRVGRGLQRKHKQMVRFIAHSPIKFCAFS